MPMSRWLTVTLLACLAISLTLDGADARSRHKRKSVKRATEATATVPAKALKATSEDLDRTLDAKIKNICRGC
jgi:hypothetical protein